MSDPVTNVEIEDVLSSIRRLVAEGEKARTPKQKRPAEDPQGQPDRLVLTPAQRITEPESDDTAEDDETLWDTDSAEGTEAEDDWSSPGETLDFVARRGQRDETREIAEDAAGQEDDAAADDAAAMISTPPTFNRSNLEAKIAELEAAVSNQQTDFEPDGSETETTAGVSWPPVMPPLSAVEDAEEVTEAGDTTEAAAEDAPSAFRLEEPLVEPTETDDPIAEAIAEVEDDASAIVFESILADAGLTADDPETTGADDADDPEPRVADADVDDEETSLAEDIADIISVDAGSSDEMDEDAGEMSDGRPADPANEARLAFRHLSQDTGPDDRDVLTGTDFDTTQEPELAAYLDNATGIDQDALRQLVRDTVREELQGRLGERITRNVRKLVRREIMRVLNAQDID